MATYTLQSAVSILSAVLTCLTGPAVVQISNAGRQMPLEDGAPAADMDTQQLEPDEEQSSDPAKAARLTGSGVELQV